MEHKLHQDREKAFDLEAHHRHELEVKLVTALKTQKEAEKLALETEKQKIIDDFLAKTDYQNSLAETKELREKIEAAKVRIQFLDI